MINFGGSINRIWQKYRSVFVPLNEPTEVVSFTEC